MEKKLIILYIAVLYSKTFLTIKLGQPWILLNQMILQWIEIITLAPILLYLAIAMPYIGPNTYDYDLHASHKFMNLTKSIWFPNTAYDIIKKAVEVSPYERKGNLICVGKSKLKKPTPKQLPSITQTKYTLIHCKNAYVNGCYGLANGSVFFITKNVLNMKNFVYKHGPIVAEHEHVIAVGCPYQKIYGHFILDCLSPLTIIPKEIRDISYIAMLTDQRLAEEWLELFGFKDRVIYLQHHTWVFASNLYTLIEPRTNVEYCGYSYYNLSLFIRNHFNITKVVPTKFGFCNRNQRIRRISNMAEIMKNATNLFPKTNFTIVPDDTKTLNETVKVWSELWGVLTVTGSNQMKTIFMKEKTVIITVGAKNEYNGMVVSAVISHNVYLINLPNPKLAMNTKVPIPVDIEDAMEAIGIAHYVYYNQSWPKSVEWSFP